MKAGLQLRFSQHLALTPQLQQSIRLLQLSTLELQQEINAALEENPLLELEESDGDDVALNADAALGADGIDDFERSLLGSDGQADDGSGSAWELTASINLETVPDNAHEQNQAVDVDAAPDFDAPTLDFSEWGSGSGGSFDDDEHFESTREAHISLNEHLRSQLATLRIDQTVRALAEMLVDDIDENGFLSITFDELKTLLGDNSFELIEPLWANALSVLQSLDPPGVGARSLSECLQLQLMRLLTEKQSVCQDTISAALSVVNDAFDALATRDYVRMRRATGLNDEDLKHALQLIRKLSPRPGAPFVDISAVQMIPDVIVRRSKNKWVAELNSAVVPRLSVNAVYAGLLSRAKEGRQTPMSNQLQEARWLVKNVAQRFDTILRVSNEIVERQQAFFEHGAVAMRPLVLREVADVLGLHESTVSRVTTQKYLASTRGTFELKYFFGSHVATDAGGAASSTAIRAMIKALIKQEALENPLTDSKIADLLGEQGIIVARRTVAKYRELEQIEPVNLRKRQS